MAFNKIRQLIPDALWRRIRYALIIRNHKRCQRELNSLIEQTDNELLSEIKPLKKLPDDKIVIWQYWAQGLDSKSMPQLINICFQSVEKYSQDYTLIRVSDENINEFLEFPDWLKEKVQHLTRALFSDLLRCLLLSKYGGLWLDATTFLTGAPPSYLFGSDLFMYQRDDSELNKEFWENTFAYYWSWSPKFLVKALTGIMYASKGNKAIEDLASLQLSYWKSNMQSPNYFFIQILIELYYRKYPQYRPKIVNDTIPHLLRQYINECPVPGYSIDDILRKTTLHSLNYKNSKAFENLLALFPEYKSDKAE